MSCNSPALLMWLGFGNLFKVSCKLQWREQLCQSRLLWFSYYFNLHVIFQWCYLHRQILKLKLKTQFALRVYICRCMSQIQVCPQNFELKLFQLPWEIYYDLLSSVQFGSLAQSCPTPCDPMNHSTPGLPVHHQLPEFTQTHVHPVGDAIQPSRPLSALSPPALNPSKHQGLFQWVNSFPEVAKVLEFQLQHQSFQWTPRTDLL